MLSNTPTLLFALLTVSLFFSFTSSLCFDLQTNREQCIYDIIEKDTLASGEYRLLSLDASGGLLTTRVGVKVTGPGDVIVFKQDHITDGKFTFTAQQRGLYKTCFNNRAMMKHEIEFIFKVGAEAKDLQDVVQLNELKPIEAEMLRLRLSMKEIRSDLMYMKRNEAKMRDLNESTNSGVAKFSIFSVIVCLTLGVWQVFHLRNYFIEKKLL